MQQAAHAIWSSRRPGRRLGDPTGEFAELIGFDFGGDLYEQSRRLIPSIMDGKPITGHGHGHQLRPRLATRAIFASDIHGVGWAWQIANGERKPIRCLWR